MSAPVDHRRKEDQVCAWHQELEEIVHENREFIMQARGIIGLLKWIGFSHLLTLGGLVAVLFKLFGR